MTRVPIQKNKKSALTVIPSFIFFLVIIAASCELVSRTKWVEKISPYRSVGNYHYQFEIKWFRLQDYVKQNGGVDILILGNSLVNTGIDPEVMADVIFEQTGIKLRIFNFGVEGLTVAPNSVIAGILMERYHPALLIYVTEMGDYVAGNGMAYETRFLADPWLQYELGNLNWPGWAIDHSAALQHYLSYRNWMRADFLETMPIYLVRNKYTTTSGYEPEFAYRGDLDANPDPNNPKEAVYFHEYSNYQISPTRLSNLRTILELKQNITTPVLIVEMPVHSSFYVYVGGEDVHKQFQQSLAFFIQSNGGVFLPADACNDIPIDGHSDRWHLNFLGAPIFSTCLGQQLIILANQENTDFVNMNTGGSK
jgi:hypothetical protein